MSWSVLAPISSTPDSHLSVVTASAGGRPRVGSSPVAPKLSRRARPRVGTCGHCEKQLRSYGLRTPPFTGRKAARAARETTMNLVRHLTRCRFAPARGMVRGFRPGGAPSGNVVRQPPATHAVSRRGARTGAGFRSIDSTSSASRAHAGDIRAGFLEYGRDYTRRFGGERVTHSDVLHAVPGNSAATRVADLRALPDPSDIRLRILTQVLLCIEDVRPAIRTVHRI